MSSVGHQQLPATPKMLFKTPVKYIAVKKQTANWLVPNIPSISVIILFFQEWNSAEEEQNERCEQWTQYGAPL